MRTIGSSVIVLVLGAPAQGKSQVAEELAARLAAQSAGRTVTFLATAVIDEADADFVARIEEHRSWRPASWETVEVPLGGDLGSALERAPLRVALVELLGTWLAGFPGFAVDTPLLTAALNRRRPGPEAAILVSDEVGLGVHPETRAGLEFRDPWALSTVSSPGRQTRSSSWWPAACCRFLLRDDMVRQP